METSCLQDYLPHPIDWAQVKRVFGDQASSPWRCLIVVAGIPNVKKSSPAFSGRCAGIC